MCECVHVYMRLSLRISYYNYIVTDTVFYSKKLIGIAYWLMGFPIVILWGARFTSTFFVFSVIWLDGLQGYFLCFSLLILLCKKHNKAGYEAY